MFSEPRIRFPDSPSVLARLQAVEDSRTRAEPPFVFQQLDRGLRHPQDELSLLSGGRSCQLKQAEGEVLWVNNYSAANKVAQ
jgi:hypothetical protein